MTLNNRRPALSLR